MWPAVDLVTFTEEILNGKLHFLCSVFSVTWRHFLVITGKFLWSTSLSICFSCNHNVFLLSTIASVALFSYVSLVLTTIFIGAKKYFFWIYAFPLFWPIILLIRILLSSLISLCFSESLLLLLIILISSFSLLYSSSSLMILVYSSWLISKYIIIVSILFDLLLA